jgi:hypothetical protein
MIAAIGDHQIVENAAALVREERIALAPRREAEDIRRHEPFERPSRIGNVTGLRTHNDLPHVRDIEQTSGGACVQMLLEHARRILDRHLVAGE